MTFTSRPKTCDLWLPYPKKVEYLKKEKIHISIIYKGSYYTEYLVLLH